ncbi:MAG: Zn-dependent hydrolase [Chloroflexi bacterium]|nr:Zn-dependent hydrolase [Chloroflexota bacterium]MDL1943836.1 Zn-dependent hydrolase [Chloroflexi bacterium CFX2]
MTQAFSFPRINPDRLLDSFTRLAAIGATAGGGVNRPAFSEAHLAARRWFREEIERSGLEFRTDGAGNHSAFLPCSDSSAPTLILGSHLDSVPNGGRFDGALGVVAALEVLKTVRENRISLNVHLEAMDFTDEEGTLVGLLGSAALAGHLRQKDLESPRGGRENLVEGMKRAGLSDESMLSAARPKNSLAGYLELHIEQGKRLERAGVNIGIVTAIVGIASYRLSFIGKADHAGSTTMDDRRDASLGASAFTLAARGLVMRDFPNCVVNVGKMEFAPGAFNIVPAQVDAALEFRSPDEAEFKRLDKALLELAEAEAARFGLELRKEFLGKHSPSLMSETVRSAFAASCDDLGLTHMPLPSGAGHDGQSLADLCPVGMIFVPSVDGASHSPREFTKWEDCVNGANVLLQAALRLGSG